MGIRSSSDAPAIIRVDSTGVGPEWAGASRHNALSRVRRLKRNIRANLSLEWRVAICRSSTESDGSRIKRRDLVFPTLPDGLFTRVSYCSDVRRRKLSYSVYTVLPKTSDLRDFPPKDYLGTFNGLGTKAHQVYNLYGLLYLKLFAF